LYSGLLFAALAGILVTPVFHRLLHTFHVEDDGAGWPAGFDGHGSG
jgi:hypothetical protein